MVRKPAALKVSDIGARQEIPIQVIDVDEKTLVVPERPEDEPLSRGADQGLALQMLKGTLSKTLDDFPEGSTMLDYGCGHGWMGMALAADRGYRLAQADINDARKYFVEPFVKIEKEHIPRFERGIFDVIFLCDVLQRLNYGISPEPGYSDRFRVELLKGLSTGLTEKGKIVITGRGSGLDLVEEQMERVFQMCPELKDEVVVLVR